jgi:hypothetical protein
MTDRLPARSPVSVVLAALLLIALPLLLLGGIVNAVQQFHEQRASYDPGVAPVFEAGSRDAELSIVAAAFPAARLRAYADGEPELLLVPVGDLPIPYVERHETSALDVPAGAATLTLLRFSDQTRALGRLEALTESWLEGGAVMYTANRLGLYSVGRVTLTETERALVWAWADCGTMAVLHYQRNLATHQAETHEASLAYAQAARAYLQETLCGEAAR